MSGVLVTGAHGFIGQAVTRVLTGRGYLIIPFDRPHTVLDREQLAVAMDHADGVINLAGQLGTSEIFGGEADAVAINIGGAVNVYDLAAERDIPVVQIGTGHKGQPNPYAITKAAAEDLGLARARYCHDKINVVRAFHVYGPGQKATPPYGQGTVRKIIPSFITRALAGADIEIYGSGDQRIDLVYVDDVAEVLVDALAAPYGQLLEAGTGKPTSVLDAARDVRNATRSSSAIVHRPMRDGEPEDTTVVADAPTCLDPWPSRLDDTIRWYTG